MIFSKELVYMAVIESWIRSIQINWFFYVCPIKQFHTLLANKKFKQQFHTNKFDNQEIKI